MKKILSPILAGLVVCGMMFAIPIASASNAAMIQNMTFGLKATENPPRLEIGFTLTEAIDLKQGNADIIYEYFSRDSEGNLVSLNYKKDKSWAGYINTLADSSVGARKYSSGAAGNSAYADNVPTAALYTSVKSGTSIDVTKVEAVAVTVLRANGSGEKLTVFKNGTTDNFEVITEAVVITDSKTGIVLESTTAELPTDTVLIAKEVTDAPSHSDITALFANVKNFVMFDIKLQSEGKLIQPDGFITVSIPIPEGFNTSRLSVYRIVEGDTKKSYPVTVTSKDNIQYAVFETNHFSLYVLTDESSDDVPDTGDVQSFAFHLTMMILAAAGIILLGILIPRRRVTGI